MFVQVNHLGRNNFKIDKQSFIKDQSGNLCKILERNFSEELINTLAVQTGFVKRSRKLSAAHFVNTLMFSSIHPAYTSLPDMTADLHQQFLVDISKEAMHKRFNQQAVNFLKELIRSHIAGQLLLEDTGLNRHFKAINIKDSSKFSLPDVYGGDYPNFGNFSKTKGIMNIQYEFDILSGNWKTLELTSLKVNDQCDSNLSVDSLRPGELYIRDLGYITPSYLKGVARQGASFLNRLPTQAGVYTSDKHPVDWKQIDKKFKIAGTDILDIDITVYEKHHIPCRLIIERVPDEVYRKRINQAEASAKSHGCGLTNQRRARCRYNTFITNVDRLVLPMFKIKKIYYLRWQIELVFKTWKSFLNINKVKKVKKERLECQLLAKLLWVLLNWRILQQCNRHVQKENPSVGISILKFFKRCITFSASLRLVILRKIPIVHWLAQTLLPLIENTKCEAPKGKTTHYEIISSLS